MAGNVKKERLGDLTEEERLRELLYQAMHANGLNPESAFTLLAALLERYFPEDPEEDLYLKGLAFSRLIEEDYPYGLGIKPADKLAVVVRDFRHPHEDPPFRSAEVAERMNRMRTRVGMLLKGVIEKEHDNGGDRRREFQSRGTRLNSKEDTADYIIARLKRDDPELAGKVVRGEMTPNAAAKEKGWRAPRIVVTTPQRTAVQLRKHMPPEDIILLAAELLKTDAQ